MAYYTPPTRRGTYSPVGMSTRPAPAARVQMAPKQRAAFTAWIAGLRAQQAQPGPAGVAPNGAPGAPGSTFVLPGSAEAEFAAQRSNIGETYTEETAANQYALRNAQIANQRTVRDQADQYAQNRSLMPAQYVNRGILGSGIYRGNLAQMVQMRQRQQNDTNQDYTRQIAGLRLGREGIERRRALSLANLRMKHQAVLGDAAGRTIK